jgi:hypothetical protein
MKRTERRSPWLLSWNQRPHKTRKIRKTERQIQDAKDAENWKLVSRLKYLLRKAWWGYKKIKNKS